MSTSPDSVLREMDDWPAWRNVITPETVDLDDNVISQIRLRLGEDVVVSAAPPEL